MKLDKQESFVTTASHSCAQPPTQTIAIIGGGLSGTLVAVHLLRSATPPVRIHLIERRSVMGQGLAYSTQLDCHLLNVPAGKMSAFADQPNHFLDWAQQQLKPLQQGGCLHPDRTSQPRLPQIEGIASQSSNLLVAEPPQIATSRRESAIQSITAQTFVPRQLYGRYLQSVLAIAVDQAPAWVEWQPIVDEAISIHPIRSNSGQVVVTLSSGKRIQANRVVLALGNFPPSNPSVADPSFYQSRRYVRSAWCLPQPAWAEAHCSSNDSVLLIGSGLTAVDQVVALHQQGYRGQIWMVSRRGLLPQSHQSVSKSGHTLGATYSVDWSACLTQPTLRALIQQVRQEIEWAAEQGYDWRAVIDSLRSVTPSVWQTLSIADRQRFLRHIRPYWDIHRHRVAPTIAQIITQLRQTEQLQICAGRIQSYTEDTQGVNVAIHQRHGKKLIVRFNWVVNCTGSEDNYNRLQHPLVQQLLEAGLIRPDPLKLGLETRSNGNLVQANGTLSPWLYTLGSPCKGQRWETTSVPKIRVQSKQLAEQIMRL